MVANVLDHTRVCGLLTELAIRLDVRDSADTLVDFNRTHRFRHTVATSLQMGGIASDASLDKIRERPLPATSPFGLIMISVDERAVMTSDQAIGLAVAIDDAMLHQILLHHMPNRCIGCN